MSILQKEIQRSGGRECSPIRSRTDQGIVKIRDADDARFQRNCLSAQIGWIAAAIKILSVSLK